MSTSITKSEQITMSEKKQITSVGDGLLVLAPAKINLSLLIAGKRADGFHNIETIMAKVDLFDEILFQPGQKPGIGLVCKGPCWAPDGKGNLIYQACKLVLDGCGTAADIKITVTKNIPAGAGLGSASSDAAATLIGINQFLQLGLGGQQLRELAPKLGSDVAFFLDGPLSICAGRGEKIEKLSENFNFQALLILPDISVSTKKVYANYRHNPALYEKLRGQINELLEKNRIDLVPKMCTNMLEVSSFGLYKELALLKERIESLGIRPLCMSGSGSGMFYIIDDTDEERVEKDKHKLEENIGCKSIIVRNNRW